MTLKISRTIMNIKLKQNGTTEEIPSIPSWAYYDISPKKDILKNIRNIWVMNLIINKLETLLNNLK